MKKIGETIGNEEKSCQPGPPVPSLDAKHVQVAGRLLAISANVVAEFGRCPLSVTLNLIAASLSEPEDAQALYEEIVVWARKRRNEPGSVDGWRTKP